MTVNFALEHSWRIRWARLRRRTHRIGAFAWAILTARPEARFLTPAACAFLAGWSAIAADTNVSPAFIATSFALFALLAIAALIDGLYLVLPDGPLLALAVLGVLIRLGDPPATIGAAIGAALTAYAAFWLLAWLFEKCAGRQGLGGGDLRLFAVAGLWIGWEGLPSCLMIATFSALISVLPAWRAGRTSLRDDPLPFGPHIALGLWLVWMFGPLSFDFAWPT